MDRLFLGGLLLRSCFAVSLRRNAKADRETEACTDAAPGHWCHAAVTWAKTVGYEQHPEWFPGDASQYSLRDFQSLLHSLGEAECSRPCSQNSRGAGSRALGLLEFGENSTAKLVEESAPALDQTSAYGFSPAEFTEMMEESWEPKATTSTQGADKTDEAGCQDAQRGSMCHHAMTFLRTKGIAKHPAWYPTLNGDSTMRDVQEVLHTAGKADCPKPCPDHGAQRLKNFPNNDVIEVFEGGRQVASEAYELKEATECGDTVEGEWCYNSIKWLKNTGLAKHPDWYPHLTRESSMADFQTALHDQRKMNCPLPCNNVSSAANTDTVDTESSSDSDTEFDEGSQEDITTTLPTPIRTGDEQCEDALEGSHCYKAISRVIDVGLWMHPEKFRGLNRHSSRDEVQKHLYLQGKYECGWPCPKKQIDRSRRVMKRVEDMTEKELGRYMSHEWDGYVDSDEYDPHEAVQPSEADAVVGAPAAEDASKERVAAEPVAAESAMEPKEGGDAATLPSKDESPPEMPPVVDTKRRTGAGLKDQCRDAQVGELCYSAVTWARGVGVIERPQWYTGLSKASTFREFQAFLHKSRPGICEMPCGNLREARPFEVEAEAADTSEELLPVIDGSGQKFVPTTTTAPTPELLADSTTVEPAQVQSNSSAEESALEGALPEQSNSSAEESALKGALPAQSNSSTEESALEEADSDTSEEALPAVDPEGREEDSPAFEAPAPQREANSTEEANSTAEEPAPQPKAARVEAAENDTPAAENATAAEVLPAVDRDVQENDSAVQEPAPQREADSAAEVLPAVDRDVQENDSAVQEPAPQREANSTEEANSTAEEPAPQPEAATVEAAEADASEEPLPVVDPDGQEIDIAEEDMAAIAQQTKEQASEPPSAEDTAMEAEQAAALQGAGNDTEAGKEANSTAEEPAPQPEAATVESDTSEEPLPTVDPDGQEIEIAFEDMEAIAQQPKDLKAQIEALMAENARLKAKSAIVQPAPAPAPQPEANATAEQEPALEPDTATVPANSTAEEPAPQPEATTVEEEAQTVVANDTAADSDDNATGIASEKAAFAREESIQPRPRRKAMYSDPLPYINQDAQATSIMQERDEEEEGR